MRGLSRRLLGSGELLLFEGFFWQGKRASWVPGLLSFGKVSAEMPRVGSLGKLEVPRLGGAHVGLGSGVSMYSRY
jgi:hypothetical protein